MLGRFPEKEFLQLLERLATTPGPSLRETKRLHSIKSYLDNYNIPCTTDHADNLWISLNKGDWGNTVVFDAHVDVVEKGYCEKLSIKGDKISGLGVGDNLTAVTMLLLMIREIFHKGPTLNYPLRVLFSVGEEGEGNLKGVRQVVRDYHTTPLLFISFDISYNEYSKEGLGSNRYKIEVQCPGGHSWHDYGRPNAISQLIDYLQSVEDKYIRSSYSDTSFNIGLINGGTGINSIARHAEATFEFRSTSPTILETIDSIIIDLSGEFERTDVILNLKDMGKRPAALETVTAETDKKLQRIYKILGIGLVHKIRSTNINIPLSAGWPSVCMGLCDCYNYHREDEYVVKSSLPKGWEVLKDILLIDL